MFGNWWFKKEKPLPGLIGLGGGATGYIFRGGAAAVEATGGTKYETPDSTYHVFTATTPAPFAVTAGAGNITVMLVGGGGPGACGGGGGGGIRFEQISVDPTYTITCQVGAGGNSPYSPAPTRANGSDTTWDPTGTPLVAGGGGAGGVAKATNGTDGSPYGGGGGGSGSGGPTVRGSSNGGGGPPGLPWAAGYGTQPGDGPDYGNSGVGGGGAGSIGTKGTIVNPYPGGSVNNGVGGNGGQCPSDFLPTNAPPTMTVDLGEIATSSPEWRYFGAGGMAGVYAQPGAPPANRYTPHPGADVTNTALGSGGFGKGGAAPEVGGDGLGLRGGGGGGGGPDSADSNGGKGIIIVKLNTE